MSENRPEDANALWAGPVMVIGGFDSWRGHKNLVVGESREVTSFPISNEIPDDTKILVAEEQRKYAKLAVVPVSMDLVRGDDSMFSAGHLEFECRLGKSSDGEWHVMGLRFDQ